MIEALSKYKFSWPAFDTMGEVPDDSRWLLPYAAMWVKDGVKVDEGDHKRAFDRYKRTLWNWLYGNAFVATRTTGDGKRGRRKHFYPDCSFDRTGDSISYTSVMRRIVRLAGT